MSEVWTDIRMKMPSKRDYSLVKTLFERLFDKEDLFHVEEYNDKYHYIQLEEVLDTQEIAIELAKAIDGKLRQLNIEDCSFEMYGNTTLENCGEENSFLIERKNNRLTIREMETYTSSDAASYADYEDFCEREFEDGECTISKEMFDSADRIYDMGNGDIRVEEPDYGEPRPIDDYAKPGTIEKIDNNEITSYFEENNIPYDDDTIANLSVEDMYAILAGTYGKDD